MGLKSACTGRRLISHVNNVPRVYLCLCVYTSCRYKRVYYTTADIRCIQKSILAQKFMLIFHILLFFVIFFTIVRIVTMFLFGLPFTASQYCVGKVFPVWSFPAFYFMHANGDGNGATFSLEGDFLRAWLLFTAWQAIPFKQNKS